MQNTMTRREFVKIASVVGGSMLLGTSLFNSAFAAPRVNIQGFFSTQKLYNGVEIPFYGFNSCKKALSVAGEKSTQVVLEALQSGYKYVQVHDASREAGDSFVLSQMPRQDIFLALRLPKDATTDEKVIAAFNEGLAKMKTDYLDLVLVEIPQAQGRASWLEVATEVWQTLEDLYKQKRVRAIGVVDLQAEQFNDFIETCEIKPMINQLNISPFTSSHTLKTYIERLQHHKIVVSTTTALGDFEGSVYDPILQKVAQKHNKTGGQVALRWSLQMGYITLATAGTIEQVKEYADIFSFALDVRDMKAISNIYNPKKK